MIWGEWVVDLLAWAWLAWVVALTAHDHGGWDLYLSMFVRDIVLAVRWRWVFGLWVPVEILIRLGNA